MRLEIGNRVRCADGVYGELADIVIDPIEKRVTHLVVQPEQGVSRLVPIQLAKSRDGERREIELDGTLDEAQGFESVHEAAYFRLGESPAEDPDWDVGVENVLALPYYAGLDAGLVVSPYPGELDSGVTVDYDRVPKGESKCGGRAPSSLRTVIHWARWMASWSTGTITSRTSSSNAATSGDGRRSPSRSGPSPGSRPTRCTSPCPRTRSVPSPPFTSADTADRLEPTCFPSIVIATRSFTRVVVSATFG